MNKASRAKTKTKLGKHGIIAFDVLLVPYSCVLSDTSHLGTIPWEVIVVDEAHRLKNSDSKFTKLLASYPSQYRLLLTGTPLQVGAGSGDGGDVRERVARKRPRQRD